MNRFFDGFNSELDKLIMSGGNESVPVFAPDSAKNTMAERNSRTNVPGERIVSDMRTSEPLSESSEIGYTNAPPPAQRLRDFTPQEEEALEELDERETLEELEAREAREMNAEGEYGTGTPAAQQQFGSRLSQQPMGAQTEPQQFGAAVKPQMENRSEQPPQISSQPTKMFAPPSGQGSLPSGMGHLSAQVYSADRAIPIENATVTILSTDGNEINMQRTDRNGRTEAVALPAPPKSLSQSPGNGAASYALYAIRVEHPQFYSVENRGAQVFDGVYSIQPVALLPLEEVSTGRQNRIIEPSDTRRL